MDPRGVREIPLSKGKIALVDAADYEWLSQWKWYASGAGHVCALRYNGHGRPRLAMHRQIIGDVPAGMVVDHINGNPLDNRRTNLRVCTTQQNTWNGKQRSKVQPFKGVSRDPTVRHLWRARICVDGKLLDLGRFDAPEVAARAYDAAAILHFGEFARPNFADSTIEPPPRRAPVQARGERVKGAKLSAALVQEIRARSDAGVTAYRIAKDLGLSWGTVANAARRLAWRHVPEVA